VKTIILLITQSNVVRGIINQIKDQLFSEVEVAEQLADYRKIKQRKNIGLIILDYDIIRFLNDEERIHYYNIECPRIVVTKVKGNYYSSVVQSYYSLGEESNFNTENIVKQINDYYFSVPKTSLYSGGEKLQWITQNQEMINIFESAKKVAQFDSSVLILGESGTGKDILAQIIHQLSKRNSHRMMKINCAAIPANLLEAELFGFKKGSFTNAYFDKIGKIQSANGSTLFLDEIGDLDLNLQAKLLRVIESGEVDMIGGIHPIKVDVRLITATNRNLKLYLEQNLFRKDLFYRLNVVNFEIPPLRDRLEDTPVLIDYFISMFNKKYDKKIKNISGKNLDRFRQYHWPGNVRELKNFIERLVINAKSAIDDTLLEQEFRLISSTKISHSENDNIEFVVSEFEKKHIAGVLAKNDYQLIKTAKKLGISRVTLYRKMQKYQIPIKK
jgi:transcriptional regulator with PAS, ATPase and Fis domain